MARTGTASGSLGELVGGGVFDWRPGQGTDDSDMTKALLDAYLDGCSPDRVGERFLAWLDTGPKDVGGTTRDALGHLRQHGDPTRSGNAVAHERAARPHAASAPSPARTRV